MKTVISIIIIMITTLITVSLLYITLLPVVPARGGAEVALGIYKTFLIYRTCVRRAPAKPVRACILRKRCPVSHVTFEAPLRTSHFSLLTALFTLHTPHYALHTPHFTLHTSQSTLHTSHFSLLSSRSTLHIPHFTLHTSQSTLHTSHSTLHTALFTPHTSHCTLHTPHFISPYPSSSLLISSRLICHPSFHESLPSPTTKELACAVVLLSKNMTCARPRCNATSSKHFPHTSHCTPHFTLALHLSSSHLSSSHLVSCLPICQLSSSWLFSCQLLPSTDVYYKSSQKPLPSTTLYYETCTKHFPVLLCTTKLAQSTSQYYFVLQSLHKVLPSTTLYYKACTKHFPVLLCTTKLQQSTSQYYFVLQSLQKVLPSTTLYYKACKKYFPVLLCDTKLAQSLAVLFPHITVWGSCFSPRRRVPHSPQPSHLTHHSTTHHTLITALLITPLVNHTTLSHHSTTHHTTCQSHHAVMWQAQYTECGRRSTQSLLAELLRAWSPAGPRLAFVWQAQYTGPAGGAAARVVAAWPAAGVQVAGGVHRACCCARGRRLARGWLSCGRRITQSLGAAARGRLARGWLSCGRRITQCLLEELLRAWSPPGPRLAFV